MQLELLHIHPFMPGEEKGRKEKKGFPETDIPSLLMLLLPPLNLSQSLSPAFVHKLHV